MLFKSLSNTMKHRPTLSMYTQKIISFSLKCIISFFCTKKKLINIRFYSNNILIKIKHLLSLTHK